jgi:hypothetical protein
MYTSLNPASRKMGPKKHLLFTNNYPRAKQEIEEHQGKVIQHFGEGLILAQLPKKVLPTELKYSLKCGLTKN